MVTERVPSYLGSSFAFIGPVAAVIGSPAANTLNAADIPRALGGILVLGGVVCFERGVPGPGRVLWSARRRADGPLV